MNDLLNRVASQAMDKWEVLGLQLNIQPHQLNTIQKNMCFAEVFNYMGEEIRSIVHLGHHC